MKHYTLLYIVWAAMCLTSCLDEHPKDQLGEDAIYGSASEIYTNAVASLYNYIGSANESEGIQGTCRGVYDYNTLTTDEAMIPIRGGDWYDGGLWMPCISIGGLPMISRSMTHGNFCIRSSCWLTSPWM